jgi:hypothetical protein
MHLRFLIPEDKQLVFIGNNPKGRGLSLCFSFEFYIPVLFEFSDACPHFCVVFVLFLVFEHNGATIPEHYLHSCVSLLIPALMGEDWIFSNRPSLLCMSLSRMALGDFVKDHIWKRRLLGREAQFCPNLRR